MRQAQTFLPLFLTAAIMLNTALAGIDDARARMDAMSRGLQLAEHAQPLVGVDWNRYLDLPLDEVRATFGLRVT